MDSTAKPTQTIIVIFGAGGDLAWRKLKPLFRQLAPRKFYGPRLRYKEYEQRQIPGTRA
jgi:glucose-6-phosphate 1-dehydrogenase